MRRGEGATRVAVSDRLLAALDEGPLLVLLPLVLMVTVIGGFGAQFVMGPWAERAETPVQRSSDDDTEAEVVSVRHRSRGGCFVTSDCLIVPGVFVPTVRFTTPTGEVVETESRCVSERALDEGDEVDVFYDRANPQDVCLVDGVDESWRGVGTIEKAAMVVVFGVAFAGVVGSLLVLLLLLDRWFASRRR